LELLPMSGLSAPFFCLSLTVSALLAQSERPIGWREELAVLRGASPDAERVAAIRADVMEWFNLHPSVANPLEPAPPQPWDSEQTSAQRGKLIDVVTGILKIEEAFDLGVTVVNVTAAVSPLSPLADGIDRAELSPRNVENVTQAIPYLPGVSVDHKSARNQNGISIRGFDTRQVPMYVDGIPMYVPFDGYVDLSRFLTNDVAEIQIAKGYSSPLNGPNGLGGAVNIVTKQPERKFEGEAGIGTGPGNLLNSDLRLGTRWRQFFGQGSLGWLQSDFLPISGRFPLNASQPTYHRVNSYQRDERYSGRLGWTPRESDQYVFSYINQKGEFGAPPYAGALPTCPTNLTINYPCSTTPKYWQWPYWNIASYYLNTTTGIGERTFVKFRAFYDQYRTDQAMYDDATYSTMYKNNSSGQAFYDDYSSGASGEFTTRNLARNVLSSSFFVKTDTHRESSLSFSSKNILSSSPWQSDRDRLLSFGLMDTMTLSSRLRATVGFSADHLNGLEAQDLNATRTQLQPFNIPGVCGTRSLNDFSVCTDHVWSYNPLGSLSYAVSEFGTLFFTYADKSHFPTLKDRYSYKFGKALPNPALEPEHARNWSFGYSHVFPRRTMIQADLFRSDVRDAVESITFPSTVCSAGKGYCSQSINVGKELHEGAEFVMRSTPLQRFTLDANYTFLSRSITEVPGVFPTGTPKHKAVGAATWRLPRQAVAIAAVRYESGTLAGADNGLPIPASNFATVDLGLVVPVRAGLSVQAGIKNLFDRNYYYQEGFPEEGRNWDVNLRYRF
jgi:iron complex outermembrane recepter protein